MSLPLPPFFDPAGVERVYRVPYQAARRRGARLGRARTACGPRPRTRSARRCCSSTCRTRSACPSSSCSSAAAPGAAPSRTRSASPRSSTATSTASRRSSSRSTRTRPRRSSTRCSGSTRTGAHPAPHTVITPRRRRERPLARRTPRSRRLVSPRPDFDLAAWARHYARAARRGWQVPARRVAVPLDGRRDRPRARLGSWRRRSSSTRSPASRRRGVEIKGRNALTENYSVLRPEVGDGPSGAADRAGQPRARRPPAGVRRGHRGGRGEEPLRRVDGRGPAGGDPRPRPRARAQVVLLDDCTSPVVVPGVVDFTDAADAAFARFAAARRAARTVDGRPGVAPGPERAQASSPSAIASSSTPGRFEPTP